MVEHRHVGIHVVHVIGVGRILVVGPLLGGGHVAIEQRVLGLALIIDGIEPDDVPTNDARTFLKNPFDSFVNLLTNCLISVSFIISHHYQSDQVNIFKNSQKCQKQPKIKKGPKML